MAPTEVAPGVHRLGDRFIGFYLIEDEGALTLIDAGSPTHWPQIEALMRTLGHSMADIGAVVLTHPDFDHVGCAERARTEAAAPVYVHEADAAQARGEVAKQGERRLTPYLRHREARRLLVHMMRNGGLRARPITVVSTFSDGDTLDVPGHPRVIHTPGHTAGSCVLVLEGRGVVFSGDAIKFRNPLTGREGPQISPAGLNVSSEQALASLDRLDGIDAEIVLSGHGDPWTGGLAEAVRLARAAGPS